MSAPAALAAELRRLWFDTRRPHVFDEAKRDLAARVAALGLPKPCAHCPAASLRHALDAARRTARAERERAERAERLLVGARPPRRRRKQNNPRQLELWT